MFSDWGKLFIIQRKMFLKTCLSFLNHKDNRNHPNDHLAKVYIARRFRPDNIHIS